MRNLRSIAFAITIILCADISLMAQVKVTFNVDLKYEIENEIFFPSTDLIVVTGDLYPLTRNRTYRMFDETPIDSIYTVEITFPRRFRNKDLKFNYILDTVEDGKIYEGRQRTMNLFREEIFITPLMFDTYDN